MWRLTVAIVGLLVLVSCTFADGDRDAHSSPQPHVVRTPNFTPDGPQRPDAMWVGPPSPAQPDSLGLGIDELGEAGPDDCVGRDGRLERQIAALAKPDPRVQALMVLPGSASSPR
jgi:hypothetical protein